MPPLFLWRRSSISWRTEETAKLFVQSLDMFLDRSSPFELIDCKVYCIHTVSKYAKLWWKSMGVGSL